MLTASELTRGERLLLDRRRRGRTKAQAAAELGTTLYRYGRWERDLIGNEQPPWVALGRPAFHEASLVLRRRAGISVAEFARLVGVSAYWLSRVEKGLAPAGRLRAYWRDVVGARA